jgi:hypothetical protein
MQWDFHEGGISRFFESGKPIHCGEGKKGPESCLTFSIGFPPWNGYPGEGINHFLDKVFIIYIFGESPGSLRR